LSRILHERDILNGDRVSLVTYGVDWEVLEPFSPMDEVRSRLPSRLRVQGWSSTPAAVAAAVDLVRVHPSDALRVLILFTDGIDRDGDMLPAMTELASEEGLVVFPILLAPLDRKDREKLEHLASVTWGRVFDAGSRPDVDRLVMDILDFAIVQKIGALANVMPLEEDQAEVSEETVVGESEHVGEVIVVQSPVEETRKKRLKPKRKDTDRESGPRYPFLKKVKDYVW